jgi:hypothetical protein
MNLCAFLLIITEELMAGDGALVQDQTRLQLAADDAVDMGR